MDAKNNRRFERKDIKVSIYDEIELFDCPYCGGPGVLEEEHGWSWYVVCADCGAHSGFCEYKVLEIVEPRRA